MVHFGQADFVLGDALEGHIASPLKQSDFKPNTWVQPSLIILKDVMLDLSTSNTTSIPTWDNLDGYVETLIRRAYLGSWGVLRSLEGHPTQFKVYIAEPRLVATVSWTRVLSWLIISMFVPVSGLVWYFGAQVACKRNLILDYPVAVLLTDVSKVLGDRGSQDLDLTNLSYVTKADEQLRLSLGSDGAGKYSVSLLPPVEGKKKQKKKRGKKGQGAGLMGAG